MTHQISFRTATFDPSAEPENPFNPIAGQSALVWLRESVYPNGYESTEPDCEDWGWYSGVQADGNSYTVGATCFEEDGQPAGGVRDWTIQVVKHRSFSDALRRKNAMSPDDPLSQIIVDALNADAAFERVEVEVGR